MDKLSEVWSVLRQVFTSRTIWGAIILLLQAMGVDSSGFEQFGEHVANFGDAVMTAVGAFLVLIGYVDRRPKPGMIEVAKP